MDHRRYGLPRLLVKVRPRRAEAGVRSCHRITVRGPGGRLAGATVKLAGRSVVTGARGRRRLCFTPASPGRRTVIAGKGGYQPARARIRVSR